MASISMDRRIRVLERAWRDGEHVVGQMSQSLPAHHNPPERLTLLSPRWIELCFQTAGLWEMGIQDRMGLPLSVGQIRFGRNPDQVEGPLYSVVDSCCRTGASTPILSTLPGSCTCIWRLPHGGTALQRRFCAV